ncbi:hypothetical protein PACTADRAFT_5423 [Pachysolen tannophilus NRRL Y-2460]|uniref:RRM domain-containing protein n=1 Tax=Pachysolen tannophilus NRRL Y-2460 TaxID=669874 RepID=A0A1E4TMN8_PACTA|nr:hypothetical protein PACTADRAFT_5423 [Pachysolen tannophilus NRRL Y-2460]
MVSPFEFFQSQVGGVRTIALSYNEKGVSKGIATISFHKSENAAKAVEKYNGAPIDGGSSKLRLELIIDPTKKPLSSRIAANPVAKAIVSSQKTTKKVVPKKKPVKKVNSKRQKKTVEDLDKEMTDYFESK